ncbi:hypothetical protein [Streptomyces sp. V3I7]|uniref:hypothetical protein n=1 Tax=Streptomyces sp. V3I7 TaxID=3042278 RepID=UPI00278128D7|nr:hypothetical protein [Streptomyces sp. V3I7]MDQ0992259.1 hypothetical protein [Streptomyces sp. V3I7]
MSITQQYLLDSHRAHRHGETPPPAPGTHDWQVVRELRDSWELRTDLTGRPERGRLRRAVRRWLGPMRRPIG